MHRHEWKNTPLKNGNFTFQTCSCGGMRWYWPNVAVYGMVVPKSRAGLEKSIGEVVMSIGLGSAIVNALLMSVPLVILSVLFIVLGGIIYLWREDDVPHQS